jgi:hypothetical protein
LSPERLSILLREGGLTQEAGANEVKVTRNYITPVWRLLE